MIAADLALRLHGVTRRGDKYEGCCPAHEDGKASLSFRDADGKILVHCHAGCSLEHIAGALGLRLSHFFHNQTKAQGERRIVATYDYVDETGNLLYQAVRFEPKDFCQRRPDGAGGWIWNLKGSRLLLYRLPELLQATDVLIVEGEKDAETARRVGLPEGWAATCNPMGAGKWRSEYSEALQGKRVVILPDADSAGRRHAEKVARSLTGIAAEVLALSLPGGCQDLTEWVEAGGTPEQFHSLLETAVPFSFMSPTKNGTLHEREFAPLSVGDFLDLGGEDEAVEWIVEDYLPAGGLALLVAKPKEGKTTLAYELAVRVGQGAPFLNRATRPGGVLILALEEHPRDVRLRLRALGAGGLSNIFVCARRFECTPDTMEAIRRFVSDQGIRLVLVDTLGAFWTVREENDAAEVTQAMKPLLALARDTGASVLLIHHARKSEGSYGDEIRGSGALFASVDIAMILKRHDIQTQRVLHAASRYPETPAELVVDLTETGYVALGDPATLNREARRQKVKAALRPESEEPDIISKRAGVSLRETYRLLAALVDSGDALREGKGRKGSPFRYRANSIHATPPVLGGTLHETNPEQTEFDSCSPPSPCMNEKEPEEIDLSVD